MFGQKEKRTIMLFFSISKQDCCPKIESTSRKITRWQARKHGFRKISEGKESSVRGGSPEKIIVAVSNRTRIKSDNILRLNFRHSEGNLNSH